MRYDIIVLAFFTLFTLGIAIAIYLSDLRAPTPERRYIYSPSDSPRTRTPKRAFAAAVGCIAVALGIFTIAVASNSSGSLLTWPLIVSPGRVLQWIAVLFAVAAMAVLIGASRPVRRDSADTDKQG